MRSEGGKKAPIRWVYLPAQKEPIVFELHSDIAERYEVPPDVFEPRAAAMGYVVAAAGVQQNQSYSFEQAFPPRQGGWGIGRHLIK